jgi:hypothetical protein
VEDAQGGHTLAFLVDDLLQVEIQGIAHSGKVEQVLADFGFENIPAVFAELPLQVGSDVIPDIFEGTVIGQYLLGGVDLDAAAIGHRSKQGSVHPRIGLLELRNDVQDAVVPDQVLFYVFLKVMTSV